MKKPAFYCLKNCGGYMVKTAPIFGTVWLHVSFGDAEPYLRFKNIEIIVTYALDAGTLRPLNFDPTELCVKAAFI